jgi:hypothetical protein
VGERCCQTGTTAIPDGDGDGDGDDDAKVCDGSERLSHPKFVQKGSYRRRPEDDGGGDNDDYGDGVGDGGDANDDDDHVLSL